MISFLEGILAEKHPTHFLIDVGGVGLLVNVPLSSYDVDQEVGKQVKLLTYLHVREDTLALYGFVTPAERELFFLLIGVSGIGPPLALKILSGISPPQLTQLIVSEDARGLMKIKGVGQKMAQRLVLELKDKVQSVGADADIGLQNGMPKAPEVLDEAATALIGLGANPLQARTVVARVVRDHGDGLRVEEIIKRALQLI